VVSPLPAGPRRNLAAATDFAGRVYAIGVYTPEFPLATVERYDPSLRYWVQLADIPVARQGLKAATGNDGRIYAIAESRLLSRQRTASMHTIPTRTSVHRWLP
jgi:hypothetical protein